MCVCVCVCRYREEKLFIEVKEGITLEANEEKKHREKYLVACFCFQKYMTDRISHTEDTRFEDSCGMNK